MRGSLEHVLVLVSDDLRFAETKNAALLTANAATVIGIVQIFASHGNMRPAVAAYLVAIGLAGTVSGICGLVSFIPGAVPRPPRAHEVPAASDNLLFYHHIRKYSPDAYLRALLDAMRHDGAPPSRLERMYAEQVVASARIADRKFALFRVAIWITIAGLTTPVVALLLYATARGSPSRAPHRAEAVLPADPHAAPAALAPSPEAGA
ncbi:MAG: hypothetical protein JWM27_3358 [Gemmatimonadetes bacterium]|nr:hypothetical protein [Gemmatimonadota bacterium]